MQKSIIDTQIPYLFVTRSAAVHIQSVAFSDCCLQLIASEGDTVTPGTKVAIISKSAQPAETHVAPSEEATSKGSSPPKVEEKSRVEEKAPKVEPPKMQAPKPTAPLKTSPSEPQLPPKERERRVRRIISHWRVQMLYEGHAHILP